MGTNDNRQSLETGSTSINQDSVSRRLGINIDVARAPAANDIPASAGILPASGSLRTTPTDYFISTPRGNKATK